MTVYELLVARALESSHDALKNAPFAILVEATSVVGVQPGRIAATSPLGDLIAMRGRGV